MMIGSQLALDSSIHHTLWVHCSLVAVAKKSKKQTKKITVTFIELTDQRNRILKIPLVLLFCRYLSMRQTIQIFFIPSWLIVIAIAVSSIASDVEMECFWENGCSEGNICAQLAPSIPLESLEQGLCNGVIR
jgi:hypothetical protein